MSTGPNKITPSERQTALPEHRSALPDRQFVKTLLGTVALAAVTFYFLAPRAKNQEPTFGVVKDGSCLISEDMAMYTATAGEGVEALALHTDGVDNHGSKAKCLSAVMARIVRFNGLKTNEDLTGDPNAILRSGVGYRVPYFATTKHTYEHTKLDVHHVLANHGYGK